MATPQLSSPANIPVAILAGGLGTRLRPLTSHAPKVLVPINGQPFIAHLLTMLRCQGFRRIILCVGHLADQVEAFVGDGNQFGIDVDYSHDDVDRQTPRGTATALFRALPLLGETFVIVNGDTYLPMDYRRFIDFCRTGTHPNTLAVYRNEGRYWPSNICLDGEVVTSYSKAQTMPGMLHIDAGVAVLEARTFAEYRHISDLSKIYAELVDRRRLRGFEVNDRFFEINTADGVSQATGYFQRLTLPNDLPRRKRKRSIEHA